MNSELNAVQTLTRDDLETKFGFSISQIYDLAYSFFSEKSDKAFHLTYDDRLHLSALSLQAKHGKFNRNKISVPGFFDFFGRGRIAKWESFGEMDSEEAKWQFVRRINELCPLFTPFVEAYARNSRRMDAERLSCSNATESGDAPESTNTLTYQQFILSNESEIRAALNSQTKEQFEAYAMQQYPSDPDKRAELIANLQNRHFHEYVDYIQHHYDWSDRSSTANTKQQQANLPTKAPYSVNMASDHHRNGGLVPMLGITDTNQLSTSAQNHMAQTDHVSSSTSTSTRPLHEGKMNGIPDSVTDSTTLGTVEPNNADATGRLSDLSPSNISISSLSDNPTTGPTGDSTEPGCDTEASSQLAVVHAPSMWTRGEIREFKSNLADTKDAIVQIGCGEVITVRVPAYPSGTSIVWEFATDDYDIGFGLFFEWASSTDLTTTMPESADQDPNEDTDERTKTDSSTPLDLATASPNSVPLVDEIIPVYRRHSHEEVYCGSHVYPGMGTYLFKFDNSYSLWRSKTLYYRVYYTC